MSAVDDSKSFGRARLSFSSEADTAEFVSTLEKFEQGEIGPDVWRAFRLVRGTYGQRQSDDANMLRIKAPQGILDVPQLMAMAEVSEQYARGFAHITTRQNFQLHFLKLHDIEHIMRRVGEAGMTTREACGNSVRNITACQYAGVSRDEAFDVTPYAEAMTRYFLRHPLAASLPRKFKIAFEGCPVDHAAAAINDLGFIAKVVDGVRGFRVTVGGGTAILCKSGTAIREFLPAGEMLGLAEAVLRVFHQHGDREHRQRNRMKFLIKQLGWEGFKEKVEAELAAFLAQGGAKLPFDPEAPEVEVAPAWSRPQAPSPQDAASRAAKSKLEGPGIVPVVQPWLSPSEPELLRWRRTNVRAQKQAGYCVVNVTVPLGDITGEQLRVLADLVQAYGDGTVRLTAAQGLALRWIRDEDVVALHARLAAAGLGLPDAETVADITSCPGAEACRLAVTQSRGLGKTLGDFLRTRRDLVDAADDLNIKISGCPNGCGQHHIAGLGFQGSVRKVGDRVLPQYFVMVGGGLAAGEAKFARIAAKVPARRLTETVERLIGLYQRERGPEERASQFFQRVEVPKVKALLADLEQLTAADAKPEDFIDLGETEAFKQQTMEGECAA